MHAIPFLTVFIAGLCVAVYSMLQGITAPPAAGSTTRIGMISAPSVAAFAITFGAVGYLCTTHTVLGYWIVLALSLAGGGITIAVSAPLLGRLTRGRPPSAGEPELEGQLARVLQPVTESLPGEIGYQQNGQEIRRSALNVVKGTLARGEEVVIDRLEGETAFVEDWKRVEKRL